MANSPRLTLPEIDASQASKEVTHNEALRIIDAFVGSRVKSRTTSAEPGSPTSGDLYILPASPTGTNWGSYSQHNLAHYYGNAWYEYTPTEDVILYSEADNSYVKYSGSAWELFGNTSGKTYKSVTTSTLLTDTEASSNIIYIDDGGLSAVFDITFAAVERFFTVYNNTSYTMTFKPTGNSGIDIAAGFSADCFCDGTNVVPSNTAFPFDTKFGGVMLPPAYTVGTAPTASSYTGGLIYVSNGDAGSPCLAYSNGTNWIRTGTTSNDGSAIAAS